MSSTACSHPADHGVSPRDDAAWEPASDVLLIDGMFCAACAASVEGAIRRHPTVRGVNVNFAAEAAVVQRQATDEHDLSKLIARIAELGYSARPAGAAGTTAAAGTERADRASRDLSLRLIVALFFGMWVMLPSIGLYLDAGAGQPLVQWRLAVAAGLLCLPVVLWSALPFYRMAWQTLRNGSAGIDALVTIGTASALVLSTLSLAQGSAAVYFEVAVALIALQLLARLIDLRVRRRAREAIGTLLAVSPTRLRLAGAEGGREVTLDEVKAGTRLRILAGERLAVDGVVRDGAGTVDRSLLTGESQPVAVRGGEVVHAGERLIDGNLVLEVTAGAGRRRLDALAKQVRQLLATKAPWQRLVDRLARHFLWLSLGLAILTGLLVIAFGARLQDGALRALAVFVIACPCALSLAAPLAGLCASQAAARRGIFLRDLNAITSAAAPTHVFLDKTGTLTTGSPSVVALHPLGATNRDDLLRHAGEAERLSAHPLARAIVAAADLRTPLAPNGAEGSVHVVPGRGLRYTAPTGAITHVGSAGWFEELGMATSAADTPPPAPAVTRVWVAKDQQLLGAIDLLDTVRHGVREAVEQLRASGLSLCILSGDGEAPVTHLGNLLAIQAKAGLSPEEKVQALEKARSEGAVIAFVGDGLNDGPALAAADLGIAVGDACDSARAAAAITLAHGGVERLPALFHLTLRLRRVVRRNLAWAIAYNSLALPAAAMGWVHPALAAAAMALSSISIVLSAARAGS